MGVKIKATGESKVNDSLDTSANNPYGLDTSPSHGYPLVLNLLVPGGRKELHV